MSVHPPAAQHQHYSFVDSRVSSKHDTEFLELTRDMVEGLGLCMELVHSSQFQRAQNTASPEDFKLPLLDEVDTERLMRHAIASACLLARHAENKIGRLNKQVQEAA